MKTNSNVTKLNSEQSSKEKQSISTENLLLFLNLNMLEKYTNKTYELYARLLDIKKWSLLTLFIAISSMGWAQDSLSSKQGGKAIVTVLNIDTKGIEAKPDQMGSMVRIELEKLSMFQVMDAYDVNYVIEKNKININNCYGKMCLVEVGKIIKSDKMFTGCVEKIGKNIVVTFRLIDVASGTIEKSQVGEYLDLQEDIQNMIKITMLKMFNKDPLPEPVQTALTQKNSFENATNNPDQTKVNLSGPRMGFAYFTGEVGDVFQMPKNKGGFDAYPVHFQFGYQFEVQYLNEGNNQALFEFLPMVTGFNQNIFIPSLTIMNGFRNNKYGWEIAFGPTFNVTRRADGYYDGAGEWHLRNEWTDPYSSNPYSIEKRVDSRGELEFQAGFIIAAGKTFKSGKLNIPVNIYAVPNKDGLRLGLSFGFNAKRR